MWANYLKIIIKILNLKQLFKINVLEQFKLVSSSQNKKFQSVFLNKKTLLIYHLILQNPFHNCFHYKTTPRAFFFN